MTADHAWASGRQQRLEIAELYDQLGIPWPARTLRFTAGLDIPDLPSHGSTVTLPSHRAQGA